MSRLTWIETLDGWISGRYQIELAAPRLWVLTRRPKSIEDSGPVPSIVSGPVPSVVMRTAGSLRELKSAADELERRRLRRRRMLVHVLATLMVITAAVIGWSLGWDLTIPALVAVFALGLRTFVIWVDQATGGAWSVVSDTYQ